MWSEVGTTGSAHWDFHKAGFSIRFPVMEQSMLLITSLSLMPTALVVSIVCQPCLLALVWGNLHVYKCIYKYIYFYICTHIVSSITGCSNIEWCICVHIYVLFSHHCLWCCSFLNYLEWGLIWVILRNSVPLGGVYLKSVFQSNLSL